MKYQIVIISIILSIFASIAHAEIPDAAGLDRVVNSDYSPLCFDWYQDDISSVGICSNNYQQAKKTNQKFYNKFYKPFQKQINNAQSQKDFNKLPVETRIVFHCLDNAPSYMTDYGAVYFDSISVSECLDKNFNAHVW